MAGQGTRVNDLREISSRLNNSADKELVRWHGWLDQETLSTLHEQIDVAVLPGRSALEAMASGIPTITLGAKAYYGPTWRINSDGMAWNWGHVHDGGYEPGALYEDLMNACRLSSTDRERISQTSRQFIKAFHSQEQLDDKLSSLYNLILATATK